MQTLIDLWFEVYVASLALNDDLEPAAGSLVARDDAARAVASALMCGAAPPVVDAELAELAEHKRAITRMARMGHEHGWDPETDLCGWIEGRLVMGGTRSAQLDAVEVIAEGAGWVRGDTPLPDWLLELFDRPMAKKEGMRP